jgi:hypothetical protein
MTMSQKLIILVGVWISVKIDRDGRTVPAIVG